jgi:hypothetical protein
VAAPPDAALASLSERDLAHIWEGQRFPPEALSTTAGEPLSVVYRGRRGRGPGPDYRDAVIRAPGRLLRGDVELHVRASDFRRHGHHRDGAYDALSLHLVFWADEPDTRLASGRRVSVAALAPWLERRSAEIQGWLERPALWEEPCRSAPARLEPEAIAAVLDRLGDIRFRARAAEMRRAAARQGPEQALYGALMEGLGYGGNSEPFLLLAERLPWRALRPALLRLAPERRYALALASLETAAASPPPVAWRGGGRPENHPARRLAAAAALAARYAEAGLLAGLVDALPEDAPGALEALVVRRFGRALLGRGRSAELLTNAVLPALAARGGGSLERALALYRSLARPAAYGAVRHLDEAVGGAVSVDARRQQGMLFLLRNYCSRGRCGSCPLS